MLHGNCDRGPRGRGGAGRNKSTVYLLYYLAENQRRHTVQFPGGGAGANIVQGQKNTNNIIGVANKIRS